MAIGRLIEGGLRVNNSNFLKHKEPLISIITVSFNADKYIEKCIKSVISQPFQNIEHIIIDGNSTDNTVPILKIYDQNIAYWRSEKDTGIYNAMNKALKFAKGKWFYFLGADDSLLAGFSKMAERLKHENTLYYGNCIANGRILGGKISKYQVAKRNVCHQAVFYPASVFKKYQYIEKYCIYADHALNIQCWSDTEFIKKYFKLSIADYNLNGFSSHASDDFFKADKPEFIKSNLGNIVYYRYLFKKWKEQLKKSDFF